ncbi:MAG TPA: hypothetical protein VFG83_01500, partial [Kofleriaceae bacterium]|nr:hypothetical protein [Kofleriaceae bacterium]
MTQTRTPFAQLIDDNWRQLFDFSFRMTLSRDTAAAAVKEAFLRAYVGQESIPGAGSVRVWLLRIVHHVLEHQVSRA